MAQSRAWHVFISYARLPDSAVALQLRRYLMSITRPWWGFSNLRVFLDKDTMVPTSELRVQIAEILSASSSMVLLACPESAQSPWVSEEVDQWMDERGKRPLIVVHTGGVLEFLPPSQDGRGGVAWKTTTALNPARFKDDPARKRELDENSEQEHTYWISDLLPVAERLSAEAGAARPDAAPTDTAAPSNTAASTDAAASTTPSGASLTRRRQAAAAVWASARLHRRERAALRRTAYDVLAGVLDLDRDRLSSFETRRRRSSFAAITSVVVALAALLTATVIAQVRVQYDTKQAFSRQLAADAVHNAASDPDVAALVAVQAYHIAPTEEAKDAVVAAASGPSQRVLRGHTAPVTSVAAGGDIAVTGSEDGTARVWDAHTGAPVNVLTPGCGVIQQVAVSPDAQLLLIVCPTTVRSFDLPTGTLRGSLNVNGSIDKLAYSAEHDIAVVEGGQGNAWMWQPSTGRLLHTLSGHAGTVTAAAVTADGRTAATGDMAGGVRLWDVSTGELEAVLRPGNNINVDAPSPTFVGDLAFTGDGRTLTVADNDGTASLWNVTSRSRSHLLTGASGGILSVATSPDNTTVATASLDGSVRTWDTATGALRQTMSVGGVGSGFIRSVRFSHDGRSLLTVSQNQLAVLWDAHDGTRIATLSGHTAPVQAGEFCPDDSCVVTGSGDGTARLWNTGAVLGHLVSDTHQTNLRTFVYGPGDTVIGAIASPGPAFLLNAHDPATDRQLNVGSGGAAIDISPDGHTVATGGDDGLVRLWDLSGGEQLSLLRGHTAAISGVSFSPDGSLLVSTGYDMTLRLWDAHTGALQHVLTNDWHNPPFPAFDPTDHLVATSDDYEENIQIWDTQSGKLTQHLTPPYPLPNQSNGVETLAFSPDGKILATSGQDHTVYLWDPHTGALIRALRDPTDDVTQIEFSPDGQEIAAAGSEHVARIWNVSTGQQLFVLSGYTDELDSLDFSHDGRLIAASSYDGSLRFWDADTGQLLKTVTSHPEFALLLFSHDSKTLAKMSRTDGTIRTFDPPPTPENAVTVICKAIGRNLTDAEWGRYATDQQRPDACPADK